MNSKSNCLYGIFSKNDLVEDVCHDKQRTALLGSIVKIEDSFDTVLSIKFLKENHTWESSTFHCSRNNITLIAEKLWPYIKAIESPIERVNLAKNRELCKELLSISVDCIVTFIDKTTENTYLGQIKFMGKVKGIGHCVGIKLHKKKIDNKCDGSCSGIQYFTCLPGYGVFTTIDKILPYRSNLLKTLINNNNKQIVEIENPNKHTTNNLNYFDNSCNNKTSYEDIVTIYGDYPKNFKMPSKNTNYMRNSLSLQNIVDVDNSNNSINTNNDFDQNTIIQPDKTYLMTTNGLKKNNNKSEIDLIEVISGGSWSETSCLNKNDNNKNKKTLTIDNNNDRKNNNIIKSNNQLMNSRTKHIANTLPKKYKIFNENDKPKSQFYVDNNEEIINSITTTSTTTTTGTTTTTTNNNNYYKTKLNERNNCENLLKTKSIKYQTPPSGTTNDLTIGCLIEISNDIADQPLYGVIKWMGKEIDKDFILVGVELEDEHNSLPLTLTNGTYNGERYFNCADNKGLFVPLTQCQKDSRFQDSIASNITILQNDDDDNSELDKMDCPVIKGAVAPLCMPTEKDVEAVCAQYRGIQGHHNSCYLDVTLFAMFTYTAVFDNLLFRPKGLNDIDDYEEVQRVLREEIVNPLRKNLFVSADHVMNLRKLLDRLSSVSGLTSEEKDPEEFLNSLLAQILKAEPFLKLNSGQEAFYYQLFVEKKADLTLPTVQQLFEQSFLTSNIKLKEVPSCLIIQMPRFGKNYKMYPRILPSQLLDVTDVIEGSPRQCIVCGKLARWECRECFDDCSNAGLESTAFCNECLQTAHRHEKRSHHKPETLQVPHDFVIYENHCRPPRLFMELFAVICIETSHYVTFVKCGVGHEAPWCFFDSMADRKGERNGYNIPEMVACPDVSRWLSDERICRQLHEQYSLDRHLPEHARRLLCDAYICMYQSSDVMMYR